MIIIFADWKEPGKVFSREELQGMITDERRASSPRAVDEHIRKLREKIETIGGSSRELQSIRGAGYKFG